MRTYPYAALILKLNEKALELPGIKKTAWLAVFIGLGFAKGIII
jgi:hypothetical protein